LPSPLHQDFLRLYDIGDAKFALNLIVDADDGFAPPGASKDLTNPRDRQLFHHLRSQCDLILIGAQTARMEPYRKHVKQVAVMTRTGEFPDHFYTGVTPWVITTSSSQEAVASAVNGRAEIITIDVIGELTHIFSARKIDSVLCEGGQVLALQLAAHDLLDLIFLTRTAGRSDSEPLDIENLTRGVQSISEIVESGITYQRYERYAR
jgi:hypothetical protein